MKILSVEALVVLAEATIFVVNQHSKGGAWIRVNRELPHEGATALNFDNFARICGGGREVCRISIGRNQVAVGCEDQTKGPMQHCLIVKDHLPFAKIRGCGSRAFQLIDSIVTLGGHIESIVLTIIGKAG